MDGEDNSAQDQISLYGLFGDSSTTLQGLNDHLSPSLLQQSPPCGSTSMYSVSSAPGKSTFTSPLKVFMNDAQQQVFLSDLADRSPSAGSVTVASLCSHVSIDNLRCTNLVTLKGRKICNQHSGSEIVILPPEKKKSLVNRPPPSTHLKQTVTFASPITASTTKQKYGGNLHVMKPSSLKAMSPVVPKNRGIDVPDKAIPSGSSGTSKDHSSKLCVVRKVGQQITVSKRIPTVKVPEGSKIKISISPPTALNNTTPVVSTTAKISQTTLNTQQPLQAVRLNVLKNSTSSSSVFPYYKKIEPCSTKSPSQGNNKFVKSTSYVEMNSSDTQALNTSKVPTQSVVVDETTLKKIVDVLNARSDMSTQQQISLLRSMGITVVQAPNTSNVTMISRKKQPTSVNVNGNTVDVKKKVVQCNIQTKTTLAQNLKGNSSMSINKLGKTASPVKTINSLNALIGTEVSPNIQQQILIKTSDVSEDKKLSSGKPAVKRKQKIFDAVVAKRPKVVFTSQVVGQQSPIGKPVVNPQKKVKNGKFGVNTKNKKQKTVPDAMHEVPLPMFLSANKSIKLPVLPQDAPISLQKLAKLLSDEKILKHDLFCREYVTVESNTDKGKTVKQRLIKKHLAKRKVTATEPKLEYKNCLKNLFDTGFLTMFSTSQTMLNSYNHHKKTSSMKSTVHHESFLRDLSNEGNFKTNFDSFPEDVVESHESDDHLTPESNSWMVEDEKLCYTIYCERLEAEYKQLEEQFRRDQNQLQLVLDSYKDNPALTEIFLKSTLKEDTFNTTKHTKHLETKRCHLSIDNALCCDSPALPYTLYCKEHIWHCSSQCLYKLNQNMQPTADIVPEPLILVKKARKRTKLLPLTKKHKKKKKRKIEETDAQEQNTKSISSVMISKSDYVISNGHNTSSNNALTKSEHSKSSDKELLTNVGVADDLDDTKPSDTSEEDLHLTGHEIMLSGVFDKLPDDPEDFDLFTTDKGAEELERALLLAASSPTPDQDDNKFDLPTVTESTPKTIWCSNDKERILNSVKTTPESIPVVVCDAPRSNNTNEQPPSIEDFNQSQCVHYTFGSSSVASSNKKQDSGNGFAAEDDLTPSLISAEDLQDIEGVLESLQKDADDVNSPKLPSSPAIDQYTSMLARQLSQEVETETLKQFSSSRHSPLLFNVSKEPTSSNLTRTYSLPATNHNKLVTHSSSNIRTVDKQASTSTKSFSTSYTMVNGTITSNEAQRTVVTPKLSLGLKSSQSNVVIPSQRFTLGTNTTQFSVQNVVRSVSNFNSSNVQSAETMKTSLKTSTGNRQVHSQACFDNTSKSALKAGVSKSTSNQETPPRKLAKKASRKITHTVVSPSVTTHALSKNLVSTSTVLTNPVLPVTLMPSPSQNGNVIKVIVPPGTVVNNTAGQQNMLLIPVSALMKSNLVTAGNTNIPVPIANNNLSTSQNLQSAGTSMKTQLSSLQAGQQFFVVNNASSSLQSQIALVRKQNISAAVGQHGLVFKTANTTVQQNSTGQKQPPQTLSKQVPCNIKPNVNVFLKQNKPGTSHVAIPPGVTIDTKRLSTSVGTMKSSHQEAVSTSSMSTTSLQAKVVNSTFIKQAPPVQTVRRIRNTTKKIVKAKFDPIMKKYVQGTTTTVDIVPPTSATTTETLSQSMMKVQQIDSVLNSLNSMKSSRVPLSNNNTANASNANGDGNWLSKSVVFSSAPIHQKIVKVAQSNMNQKPALFSTQPSKRVTLMQEKANNEVSTISQINLKEVHIPNTDKTSKSGVPVSKEIKMSPAESSSNVLNGKNTNTPVCSGTVHWNQTTTAGPQVAQTLTVPVYITGSINPGNWTSDMTAINGSIAGTNVPILLPAQKIPGQIQQRVFLGNMGPIAITSPRINTKSLIKSNVQIVKSQALPSTNCLSAATSNNENHMKSSSSTTSVTAVVGTTMSTKQSIKSTSAPVKTITKTSNGFANIPKANSNKIFQAITQTVKSKMASLKAASQSEKTIKTNINVTFQIPASNMTKTLTLSAPSKIDSPSILNSQRSKSNAPETSGLKLVQSPMECNNNEMLTLIKEEPQTKKKNSRKASHDTILHDPLMFDPTILNFDSDSSEV